MLLGNFPQRGDLILGNKRYWRFAIGRNAMASRYFDHGWYGFEFVVLKKGVEEGNGAVMRRAFRIAFAFWFPIYPL